MAKVGQSGVPPPVWVNKFPLAVVNLQPGAGSPSVCVGAEMRGFWHPLSWSEIATLVVGAEVASPHRFDSMRIWFKSTT